MGLTLFIGRFVPTSHKVSILGFGYNRTNYQFDQGQRWGRFTAGLVDVWPTQKMPRWCSSSAKLCWFMGDKSIDEHHCGGLLQLKSMVRKPPRSGFLGFWRGSQADHESKHCHSGRVGSMSGVQTKHFGVDPVFSIESPPAALGLR